MEIIRIELNSFFNSLKRKYMTNPSSATYVLRIFATILVSSFLLIGCDLLQSVESKQIRACEDDVKLGLNDPNSLEILSSRTFKVDDGTYRLELKFTFKNTMGGRERSEAICGFKTEKDTKLNPDDMMNKIRDMSRNIRELGIGLH